MRIFKEEVIFNSTVRYNVLPFKGWGKFKPTNTTPSVLNQENWICTNTGAITVTNFTNGSDGQTIRVLGDGFTSVANNASIKTRTGAAFLLAANLIYQFTYINGIWYMSA